MLRIRVYRVSTLLCFPRTVNNGTLAVSTYPNTTPLQRAYPDFGPFARTKLTNFPTAP